MYSFKGFLVVSSTGAYVDQVRQGSSLVESSLNIGISGVANTLGYGMSYVAINNKYVMPYLSQSYRNNLYSNGGHNYIHNYTTFKNSEVLSKATVIADGLGGVSAETFNQIYSKGKKDEK